MYEAILLNGLLNFLYKEDNRDSSIEDVSCSSDSGLRITCCNSGNITYRTSILMKNNDIIVGSNRSSLPSCIESYKTYLKKSEKEMLIVKEGVDKETNKIVFIRVKATNCNKDILLLELTREFDSYSKYLSSDYKKVNSFVYDSYDNSISIYPLKTDIIGNTEEIMLSVNKNYVDCSELYEKVPRLEGSFDEGLLKCMGYFLGDYKISVDIIKDIENYIPVMYFLFLENVISSAELC